MLQLLFMVFVKPKYSHGAVDRAGKALVRSVLWEDERHEALDTINNWRSAHSYPLHVIYKALRLRAKSVDPTCTVARRLKRLPSIKKKLQLQPNMKLTQMQDIGGCRAILNDIAMVHELIDIYKKSWAKNPHAGRPQLIEQYDYISRPKDDGYRSIHLVYRYQTESEHLKHFNGRRIEIQLRSVLQHLWATAVETVDLVTGQALKSNLGSPQWIRFFALMSGILANREGCAAVPGLSVNHDELVAEASVLLDQLQVEQVLMGVGYAVYQTTTPALPETKFWRRDLAESDMFLLVLNPETKELSIRGYSERQLKQATAEYLRTESEQPELQAVLVSVDSVKQLRNAYPNFYLNTDGFMRFTRIALHRATEDDKAFLEVGQKPSDGDEQVEGAAQ